MGKVSTIIQNVLLFFTGFRHFDYIHNEAQSRHDRRSEKPACGCHMGGSQVCINLKVFCLKSGMFSTINNFRRFIAIQIEFKSNSTFNVSSTKTSKILSRTTKMSSPWNFRSHNFGSLLIALCLEMDEHYDNKTLTTYYRCKLIVSYLLSPKRQPVMHPDLCFKIKEGSQAADFKSY